MHSLNIFFERSGYTALINNERNHRRLRTGEDPPAPQAALDLCYIANYSLPSWATVRGLLRAFPPTKDHWYLSILYFRKQSLCCFPTVLEKNRKRILYISNGKAYLDIYARRKCNLATHMGYLVFIWFSFNM